MHIGKNLVTLFLQVLRIENMHTALISQRITLKSLQQLEL
jgi:hypothetical protein